MLFSIKKIVGLGLGLTLNTSFELRTTDKYNSAS